jgi:hypothetical protein
MPNPLTKRVPWVREGVVSRSVIERIGVVEEVDGEAVVLVDDVWEDISVFAEKGWEKDSYGGCACEAIGMLVTRPKGGKRWESWCIAAVLSYMESVDQQCFPLCLFVSASAASGEALPRGKRDHAWTKNA